MEQNRIKSSTLIRIKEMDSGKAFEILPGEKEALKKLMGRCFLICVCGAASTGKSTLLNLLIERFTGRYQKIFPIGNSYDATTKGVEMAVVGYEDDNLIFLDTEGCCDLAQSETQWVANVLMLIASSCSFTLFNFTGNKPDALLKYLIQFSKFSFYLLRRDANLISEMEEKEEMEALCGYLQTHFEKASPDKIFLIPSPAKKFQQKLKEDQMTQEINGEIDNQTKGFLQKIDDLSKSIKNKLEQVPYLQSGEKVVEKLEALINQVPYYKDNQASEYEKRIKSITEYNAKKIQLLQKLSQIEREEFLKCSVEQNGIRDEKTIAILNKLFRVGKSLSVVARQGLHLVDTLITFIAESNSETLDLVHFRELISDTYLSPLRMLIFEDLEKILDGIREAQNIFRMTEGKKQEMINYDKEDIILVSFSPQFAWVTVSTPAWFLYLLSTRDPIFSSKEVSNCRKQKQILLRKLEKLRSFVEEKISSLRPLVSEFETNFSEILDLKPKNSPLDEISKEFVSIQEV